MDAGETATGGAAIIGTVSGPGPAAASPLPRATSGAGSGIGEGRTASTGDAAALPGQGADGAPAADGGRAIEATNGPARSAGRSRLAGIALMLCSSFGGQLGSTVGALGFPLAGPVGMVAMRQIGSATLLGLFVRPKLHRLSRGQWMRVIALAATLSVMNTCVYAAVDRIGLGLTITLEFLGPLAVAILSSRRIVDGACAIAAGVGVVVLTQPGPSSDFLGIGLALVAALMWAFYILLNRSVGRHLPGVEGTASAAIVSGVAWIPIAIAWFSTHPVALELVPAMLGLGLACAILASMVPLVCDMLALRRVPAGFFGTFASLNPVWAAVLGWIVLGQALSPAEWLGMGVIVLANVVVTLGPALRAARAARAVSSRAGARRASARAR